MALGDYDVKGQATMHFSSGSSKLSAADQDELKKLAATATGLKGYLIEVTGYADSAGAAAMNTTLSENRAKAVITYLFQQCGVPMRHIVAPGAMGEYGATATNETKAGRAEPPPASFKSPSIETASDRTATRLPNSPYRVNPDTVLTT